MSVSIVVDYKKAFMLRRLLMRLPPVFCPWLEEGLAYGENRPDMEAIALRRQKYTPRVTLI